MHDSSSLIATIVIGFGLAFVFGTAANRLRISPIVGYLLAGVAVGPFTPGFIANQALAAQLADIGVILLMFGVGLHFSLRDLAALRGIVLPGAAIQIAVATFAGYGVARLIGWADGVGIVFGLALSVASTVVLLRALQERRLVDSERGRIAVGWLVFQDLLTVIALVMLPPLSGLLKGEVPGGASGLDFGALAVTLGITLGKVAAFIVLMLVVGQRIIPAILHYIAHTGSRELFRLAVLSVALGVAFLAAELFGVSFALGAFFAGMVLSESQLSQRAAEESLPFRDAFAVLFFVSVGMLFDPMVLLREPLALLGTLGVVVVSAVTAFAIVKLRGYPLETALLVGAGLAQIGEFSFILGDLGISLGILPVGARDLILGTAILSILLNPLIFILIERVQDRLERRFGAPQAAAIAAEALLPTKLSHHAVLIGYGRVGRVVGEGFKASGVPFLVIEDGPEALEKLRAEGVETIEGNAAEDRVLDAANLPQARILLVAIPNSFEACQIVKHARAVNPQLKIVARAHFDAEVEHLLGYGANTVVMGEREIAHSMLAYAQPPLAAPAGSPAT